MRKVTVQRSLKSYQDILSSILRVLGYNILGVYKDETITLGWLNYAGCSGPSMTAFEMGFF